jgi:cyclohexa-1,5-dienecarbonyl-CoA hydratase
MAELSGSLEKLTSVPVWIVSSTVKHFSSGVDVKIHTREHSGEMLHCFHHLVKQIYHHDGITVSCIHGNALGGGMEVALACDFVFAQADASLGFPEIQLACFPPVASVLLPRKIGIRGCQYLYSGETLDASSAEEIGLIEGVFTEDAEDLLQSILQHSLQAMTLLKKVLRRTSGFDFDRDLSLAEGIYLTELIETSDMEEGVSAFLQKRKPRFRQE